MLLRSRSFGTLRPECSWAVRREESLPSLLPPPTPTYIYICCKILAIFPKGPFRTKNTTTIAKIVNYYAVVFLLRPPNLLRRGPFLKRKNVCNSQENRVRTSCAVIVNHPAVLKILRVVNVLPVVFLVRRGPLGRKHWEMALNLLKWLNPLFCREMLGYCFAPPSCQSSPDRGQSRKIRFSKFLGSGLKKI